VIHAFGHGHLGLTQSAGTARLVADLLTGCAPADRHDPLLPAKVLTWPVYTFSCLDGHTCGNPVRLVSGGGPRLEGATMLERRAAFPEAITTGYGPG
jgi:hypothetical protein